MKDSTKAAATAKELLLGPLMETPMGREMGTPRARTTVSHLDLHSVR